MVKEISASTERANHIGSIPFYWSNGKVKISDQSCKKFLCVNIIYSAYIFFGCARLILATMKNVDTHYDVIVSLRFYAVYFGLTLHIRMIMLYCYKKYEMVNFINSYLCILDSHNGKCTHSVCNWI